MRSRTEAWFATIGSHIASVYFINDSYISGSITVVGLDFLVAV